MSDASKLPVRKGLGRGLGSLIPGGSEPAKPAVVEPTPAELAAAADAEKVRRAVIDVAVELIDAMPNQPRLRFDDDGIRELAVPVLAVEHERQGQRWRTGWTGWRFNYSN